MATAKEREAYGYSEPAIPVHSTQRTPAYTSSASGRKIKKLISSSSSKNTELLRVLSETSQAPGELNRATVELDGLRKLLEEQELVVKKLTKTTKRDLKQHKRYRDSVVSKFVYRITNRPQTFDAKAMKGEKVYFESLEEQHKAENRLSLIQTNIKDAEKREKSLKVAATRHGEAHAKLDQLYEKIFAGPNPEFPEEDIREIKFNRANKAYEGLKDRYKKTVENIKYFNRCAIVLRQARYHLSNARADLEVTIFGINDYHFNAIEQTQENKAEILKYLADARVPISEPEFQRAKLELQTQLNSIPPVSREIYSRHGLVQDITNRLQGFTIATELLANVIEAGKTAEINAKNAFRQAARALEDARQALNQERQAAFEQVAGFGEAPPSYGEAHEDAPQVPQYHECCDRTEIFEQCDFTGPTDEEQAEADHAVDPANDAPQETEEQNNAEASNANEGNAAGSNSNEANENGASESDSEDAGGETPGTPAPSDRAPPEIAPSHPSPPPPELPERPPNPSPPPPLLPERPPPEMISSDIQTPTSAPPATTSPHSSPPSTAQPSSSPPDTAPPAFSPPPTASTDRETPEMAPPTRAPPKPASPPPPASPEAALAQSTPDSALPKASPPEDIYQSPPQPETAPMEEDTPLSELLPDRSAPDVALPSYAPPPGPPPGTAPQRRDTSGEVSPPPVPPPSRPAPPPVPTNSTPTTTPDEKTPLATTAPAESEPEPASMPPPAPQTSPEPPIALEPQPAAAVASTPAPQQHADANVDPDADAGLPSYEDSQMHARRARTA